MSKALAQSRDGSRRRRRGKGGRISILVILYHCERTNEKPNGVFLGILIVKGPSQVTLGGALK
jgi:hypothetical protein